MSTDPIVKLNVGGTIFMTRKSTLLKSDGYFKTHFEPDDFDYDHCIFIDRSPKHFDRILNFLRDGFIPIPKDELNLEELAIEVNFYELKSLEEHLKKIHPGATLSDVHDELTDFHSKFSNCFLPYFGSDLLKNRLIKTNDDLLQHVTSPISDTLIFYYPVTDHGVFHPDEFNIVTFIEENEKRFRIFFKTFPSTDSTKWSWSFHCKDYCERGSFHEKKGPFNIQLERTMKKFEKYKKDNKYY
ncbi:unnamed protein product [Caenorhabditis brenneri]